MVELFEILERARGFGFLGPGPVDAQVSHARRFSEAVEAVSPARALDLGSGGGLPGLVLATVWPESEWWLLDSNERRTDFLAEASSDLGLSARVTILNGRAEALARDVGLRGLMDLVTSRSFGPPAVTAECAAGFLRQGGKLVVSEPPSSTARWDDDALEVLGMARSVMRSGCQVMEQRVLCPDHYPRRVGIPKKRPLF